MLNFKAKALQIPDLLGKGCTADILPVLFWIRYARIFTCWLRIFKEAQKSLLYFSFHLLIFTHHQSSTNFSTSFLSTSKDWWRHFRNSEFVLRHSRYSYVTAYLWRNLYIFQTRLSGLFCNPGYQASGNFSVDLIWVLGSIDTKWVLHGLGFTVEMSLNCDLCHFLQYIQIFPVNIN